MTEREMLELAAKAVGFDTKHNWNAERLEMVPALNALVVKRDGELVSTAWNPLQNDGDCFRLEDDLEIDITRAESGIKASCGIPFVFERYADHESKSAARRFAVTRLAAEIGKHM